VFVHEAIPGALATPAYTRDLHRKTLFPVPSEPLPGGFTQQFAFSNWVCFFLGPFHMSRERSHRTSAVSCVPPPPVGKPGIRCSSLVFSRANPSSILLMSRCPPPPGQSCLHFSDELWCMSPPIFSHPPTRRGGTLGSLPLPPPFLLRLFDRRQFISSLPMEHPLPPVESQRNIRRCDFSLSRPRFLALFGSRPPRYTFAPTLSCIRLYSPCDVLDFMMNTAVDERITGKMSRSLS